MWLRPFRENAYFSPHLFFPFSAVLLAALAWYRLGIASLVPESAAAPVAVALACDSGALLAGMVALAAIALVFGQMPLLKTVLAALAVWLFCMAHLAGIEFFRVYQGAFHRGFLNAEQATGLAALASSAFAEAGPLFWASAAAFSVLIAVVSALVFFYDGRVWSSALIYDGAVVARGCLLAAALAAPACFVLCAGPGACGPGERYCQNPLMGVILPGPARGMAPPAPPEERMPAWGGRFNTDSLDSARVYGRIDAVPRGKSYNVVLYLFESFPAAYLNLKAGDRHITETWHRLARNALSATNHYANCPLSANVMFSIFTSAYEMNSRHSVIQAHPGIGLKTLPEVLGARGYRTCHIHTGGLAYAGQNRFLAGRGYDRILEYNDLVRVPPYNRQVGWGLDERAMIQPAVDFMKGDPSRPFFVVLQPVNPHHPYEIPDDSFAVAGSPRGLDGKAAAWVKYQNSLHYADAVLGMLVERMEREGLMDNTLFILVADHGEAFYQHRGNYGHPLFLYEENVHVPLLIYNRRLFPRPVLFTGLSRHIDILPTIQDALGLPGLEGQEGISLLAERREQMALLHTSWNDELLGLRDGRWKYIRNGVSGAEELYDLEVDPIEARNLAGESPGIAARYRDVVDKSSRYRAAFFERVLGRKSGRKLARR